jgi:hypothetical protein
VGLARAGLSIGKEGGVVALEDGLDQMRGSFVELLLLAGVVDLVEAEDLFFVILALDSNGGGVVLHGGTSTSRMSSMSASR